MRCMRSRVYEPVSAYGFETDLMTAGVAMLESISTMRPRLPSACGLGRSGVPPACGCERGLWRTYPLARCARPRGNQPLKAELLHGDTCCPHVPVRAGADHLEQVPDRPHHQPGSTARIVLICSSESDGRLARVCLRTSFCPHRAIHVAGRRASRSGSADINVHSYCGSLSA
jgi:hypothetical protein